MRLVEEKITKKISYKKNYSCMNQITLYPLIFFLLSISVACTETKKPTVSNLNKIVKYVLYSGTIDVEPSSRKLTKLRALTGSEAKGFKRYLQQARPSRGGFVMNDFYIHGLGEDGSLIQSFGVVVEENRVAAIDITTQTPEITHVTTTHMLLINEDTSASEFLMKMIRDIEKKILPFQVNS